MQNFNFKEYWVNICLPVILYDQRMTKAMRNGIDRYLSSGNGYKDDTYSKNRLPCWYGKGDNQGEQDWEDDVLVPEMIDLGILEEDPYPPSESGNEFEFDDYHEHPMG